MTDRIWTAPWEGLGHNVEAAKDVDKMLTTAGLDWDVATAPLRYELNQKGLPRLKGSLKHRALVRADTGDVLDVVGPRYVPTQNKQVLEFFREYVEAGDMELETAGSMMGGRFVWALAKMTKGSLELGTKGNSDKVSPYILLVNPHEYGKAIMTKFTAIRFVCLNTMLAVMREATPAVKIWHVKEFDADLQAQAKIDLGIAGERLEAFHENAEALVKLSLDNAKAVSLATQFFGGDEEKPSRTATRVLDLFNGEGQGSLLSTAKGTGWGFLNAVTEFYDHHAGRLQDNRLQSAWLGRGAVRKQRVMTELLKVAA